MAEQTISRKDFETKLAALSPGERVIYHVGDLAYDRIYGIDCLKVLNTALAAWDACEAGQCHLVQRRVLRGIFAYMAVKRPAPHKRVEWTGAYDPERLSTKAPPQQEEVHSREVRIAEVGSEDGHDQPVGWPHGATGGRVVEVSAP